MTINVFNLLIFNRLILNYKQAFKTCTSCNMQTDSSCYLSCVGGLRQLLQLLFLLCDLVVECCSLSVGVSHFFLDVLQLQLQLVCFLQRNVTVRVHKSTGIRYLSRLQ